MPDYKADITLNEKDSLTDMLNAEKAVMLEYLNAVNEGVSKGFRKIVKDYLIETADDRLRVFLQLADNGYLRVHSANEEELNALRSDFSKTPRQLS